jgi:carbonic anhydrase
MVHKADAVVVACIDWRFQQYLRRWTDENLPEKTFDFIGFAGATKNLETILGQIDISVRLHQIKQVALIHHEDCGAYGTESTPERHSQDLAKAKTAVLTKYPDLKVDCYYLHLDGGFEVY